MNDRANTVIRPSPIPMSIVDAGHGGEREGEGRRAAQTEHERGGRGGDHNGYPCGDEAAYQQVREGCAELAGEPVHAIAREYAGDGHIEQVDA